MTADRWHVLERLYHEAEEHAPAERDAFLAEACGADEELRSEVISLLVCDAGDSAFLDRTLVEEAARRLLWDGRPSLVGRTIGHYDVVEQLGAGGMGEVYRARDTVLDRDIALKVLVPAHGQRAPPSALLREAQRAARLAHPNVCAVHEIGVFEGQPFLAMEYVEGQTLAQTLVAGPLTCTRVLNYGRQIAAAIAHAHDHGVLHKDLKASNVLVTPDEQVKVVDFGIARRLGPTGVEEATERRSVALLAGTPGYMAPEVLRGQPADVRSDLWSFGVLLYEMATGARPFRGSSSFQVIAAVLEGPPADLASAVPAPLQTIVSRCLAPDPAARYQSATEVRAALDSVTSRDEGSVRAPDPQSSRETRTSSRWRRSGLLVVAAVGVVATLLALWGSVYRFRGVGRTPAPQVAVKRLAVLPFTLSGRSDARTLGIGLADSVISRLALVPHLQVRPSASLQRLDVSQMDIMQLKGLGPRLQIDYLLLGKGQAGGDVYEIRLELMRVADAATEWTDTTAVPAARLATLGELIGERVATALDVPLTDQERARLRRPDSNSAEAEERYLEGRAQLVQHKYPDAAVQAFEQAVALDAGYARAWAGLAHALARKYWHPESPEAARGYRARAKEAAEKALLIDRNLAEAHEALSTIARYTESEWDVAIEEARQALALDPNLELAHHNMATAFYHLGFPELSEQESLAGVRANPESRLNAMLNRARAALYDARFPAAEQYVAEVNTTGDSGDAWVLAEIQFYLGWRKESERVLRELLVRRPADVMTDRARASLATLLASERRGAEAQAMLAPLLDHPSNDHHVGYRVATALAQLRNAGQAASWLKRAADTGFPCYPWFAKDPMLDPARDDAAFKRVMADQAADWGRSAGPSTSRSSAPSDRQARRMVPPAFLLIPADQ